MLGRDKAYSFTPFELDVKAVYILYERIFNGFLWSSTCWERLTHSYLFTPCSSVRGHGLKSGHYQTLSMHSMSVKTYILLKTKTKIGKAQTKNLCLIR